MASPVYLWYSKEVFFWRSLAATLWAVICMPLLIFITSLLLNISLINPLVWLFGTAHNVFSAGFLFTIVTLIIAVVTVTWFSLPYITVKPDIHNSRLSCVLGLFRWSRLPLLVICLLNGTASAWSLTFISGLHFTDFVSTNDYERSVLNEPCLFIVACGTFTGLCYYMHFFINQEYHLNFPTIQRQKIFQVRSEANIMAGRIGWQTLHMIKYYYIIYFLFGSLPRGWVCSSFAISEDSEVAPLDSILGLMSLSLLWKTYFISFVFIFALSFTFALTKIFHTEQLEFPVTSLMEYSNEKTLPDALACTYSPLLQHLAYYDLACLSKYLSQRIQDLLSLSQPGGHPKVWMMVSGSALSTIQELTNQVKEENWSIMSKVPINQHRNEVANGNGFHFHGSSGDRLDSSLSYRGEILTDGSQTEIITRDVPDKPGAVAQLVVKLSSLPILSQLLVQSQDSSSRRLFASCQIHIWAVESLSHISVRAYTEDKYGIVQSSLPIIFMSLFELYECMEKHFKLSTTARRNNGSINSTDSVNRYKLHSILKASLYRMVDTYKEHLEDIRLKPEEIKKLSSFIQYTL